MNMHKVFEFLYGWSSVTRYCSRCSYMDFVHIFSHWLWNGGEFLPLYDNICHRSSALCDFGFSMVKPFCSLQVQRWVECRSKVIGTTICSFEGTTDHTGTYNILVADEHENEICVSVLISSPASGCKTALQGRERAQVFLTHNNGIALDTRYTNSLCFLKDSSLPVCAQLLQPMSNLKFKVEYYFTSGLFGSMS